MLELIDMSGITLLHAGAKNFNYVTVIPTVDDMISDRSWMEKNDGEVSFENRIHLAIKTFMLTSHYDALIVQGLKEKLLSEVEEIERGSRIVLPLKNGKSPSWIVIQGEELSYTNIFHFESGFTFVHQFDEPAAVILTHTSTCACGVAYDRSIYRSR